MPNDQHTSTISRRHLAQGAAWAVPVIAVGAAAPAMAASTCISPGTLTYGTPTISGTSGSTTTGWQIDSNNTSLSGCSAVLELTSLSGSSLNFASAWCDATGSVARYTTMTRTFNVVAGSCYTISFVARGGNGVVVGGTPYPAGMAAIVTINGVQRWAGHTQAGYAYAGSTLLPVGTPSQNIHFSPDVPVSFCYRATTTGPVTYSMAWYAESFAARGVRLGVVGNTGDDVAMSAPVISCTPCNAGCT